MIVTMTCQDALGKRKVWLFSGIDVKAQSRNPARSSGSSGAASVLRDSPRILRDSPRVLRDSPEIFFFYSQMVDNLQGSNISHQ